MAGNVQRSTTGLFLMTWAILMTALLLFAWRVQLHRQDYLWNEYPTALGDRDFYTRLSENDFYTPALVLPAQPHGMFRRMYKPVNKDDARMRKVARDVSILSNRVYVYADKKDPEAPLREGRR